MKSISFAPLTQGRIEFGSTALPLDSSSLYKSTLITVGASQMCVIFLSIIPNYRLTSASFCFGNEDYCISSDNISGL